ncbi:hypothetical protein LTR08_004829 [Meristemomyces frigidus]|nr:hypothetical protein LTR08_004829 [Meristemomyces frigidus]
MAEILGIFSAAVGVASFALDLAESIKKLKDFCTRVADAPKSLHETITEMEVLGDMLGYLDPTLDSLPSSIEAQKLKRCIELCRIGLERITAVTKELDRKMTKKRRWISVRYAFKKADMQEMAQKLEQGKTSLILAQQMCIQARADHTADVQHRDSQAILSGQITITQQIQILSTSTQLGQMNVWTASLKINITAYRIIDYPSPAVQMCVHGDIPGLQGLFSAGLAAKI